VRICFAFLKLTNVDNFSLVNILGVRSGVDYAETEMPGIVTIWELDVLRRCPISEVRSVTAKRESINVSGKFRVAIGRL